MKRKPSRPEQDRPSQPDTPCHHWRHPDVSDELHDAFMAQVMAFESAPTTTLSRLLIEDGIELPPPDSFTESSVRDKLWEVIRGMAKRRHFLSCTDHLNDLELYRELWEEVLDEPSEDLSDSPFQGAWHIDLAGCGSEESTEIWLRHYADGVARDLWARDFPDDPIPDHVDPPYDRDRHLPRSPMDQSGA